MQLAMTGLYRACWSNRIHDEWMRNVLKNRPDLSSEHLERTRHLMNAHAPDCLVEDFQSLESSVMLPDPDDRHVLAAAIKSGADYIVTFNLKDFPKSALEPWELEAQHPDTFLVDLFNMAPNAVTDAVRECRQRLKNPPKSVEDYLAILGRQGLPEFTRLLNSQKTLL